MNPHSDFRYIKLNKPYDVLCQFTDPAGRATLKDFVTVPGVYSVGRLDRDSEGLILLTNDGAMAHQLTNPRHAHPRTYWVQVEGEPTRVDLDHLERGVELNDGLTLPTRAAVLPGEPELPPRSVPIRFRKNVPTSWIELTLREGRNRQVRRMTAAVGYPTLRLIRAFIGPIALGSLQPGEWVDLTPEEMTALKSSIQANQPRRRRRR